VKRFLVRGTVEEKIIELQQRKRQLAQSVSVAPTPEEQKAIRMRDIVELFRTEKNGGAS
jgi:SNF2 family DNA or RNA helicase